LIIAINFVFVEDKFTHIYSLDRQITTFLAKLIQKSEVDFLKSMSI